MDLTHLLVIEIAVEKRDLILAVWMLKLKPDYSYDYTYLPHQTPMDKENDL